MNKDDELEHLRQENQALRKANQTLQECVRESVQAIGSLHKQLKELEAVIACQQERIKTLEGQGAKDSHNSSLPPSSDRFVRPIKSLRQPNGKKPGGQPGHQGHHLRQAEIPDEILIHPVLVCSHCQHDLSGLPATLPEQRQVIDLPAKRLWVREHRVKKSNVLYALI